MCENEWKFLFYNVSMSNLYSMSNSITRIIRTKYSTSQCSQTRLFRSSSGPFWNLLFLSKERVHIQKENLLRQIFDNLPNKKCVASLIKKTNTQISSVDCNTKTVFLKQSEMVYAHPKNL